MVPVGMMLIANVRFISMTKSMKHSFRVLQYDLVYQRGISNYLQIAVITQIARFMGPTWGPPGSCRPQMGPMLAPWTLPSGNLEGANVPDISTRGIDSFRTKAFEPFETLLAALCSMDYDIGLYIRDLQSDNISLIIPATLASLYFPYNY